MDLLNLKSKDGAPLWLVNVMQDHDFYVFENYKEAKKFYDYKTEKDECTCYLSRVEEVNDPNKEVHTYEFATDTPREHALVIGKLNVTDWVG